MLSAFDPKVPIAKADANLLRDFAVALTTAMQPAGVRRVVVVSTAFRFKDSIVPPTYLFGRLFFPGIMNREVSRAREASAPLRFQYFTRGRSRLFHQNRRRPNLKAKDIRGQVIDIA